ncbi:MAG: hypothetical protein HYX65_08315 [Gemmatimonadetes bacterium]|nr:hypothetical protein [Gemmatimonadota bacterium]
MTLSLPQRRFANALAIVGSWFALYELSHRLALSSVLNIGIVALTGAACAWFLSHRPGVAPQPMISATLSVALVIGLSLLSRRYPFLETMAYAIAALVVLFLVVVAVRGRRARDGDGAPPPPPGGIH